jgi:signal transduction histidine kinase
MFATAFVAATGVGLATGGDTKLYTTVYFLLLLYAVFRWGSGRAMIITGVLVAGGMLITFVSSYPTGADIIGGIAVAVTTGTLGLALRWRTRARARELDQARLVERAQLARDLHDTVAHHVSAIAIQAQAGTAVVAKDPGATAEVLRTIEDEASRTLREMRAMVGVLRSGDAPDRAPTPGLSALRTLAGTDGTGPAVAVRLEGDIDAVPGTVAAALFRIAQEAVTNARRHARGATRVDVELRIDESGATLDVRDDGGGAASGTAGYGITGMRERAALLGGACEAGRQPTGGWAVTARIPRKGWAG